MTDFYYRSTTPTVVALVTTWYLQKDAFDAQRTKLGQIFGAAASPMRSGESHYVGGLKLGRDVALDVHWRRPDAYGYRALRVTAVPPKGASKTQRTAIRAEHERLTALWQEHCPPRISSHTTWQQLGVNTGNLLLSGGVMFELDGTAYFLLGFKIDELDHKARVAAGEPTSGWIEGAEEILPSTYETARLRLLSKREGAAA